MEQNNGVEKKLTIFEQSKINTESFIEKINKLQGATQEEVDFLMDKAITSAKMEIALAQLENRDDKELSSFASMVKEHPNDKYAKKVIFQNYVNTGKEDMPFVVVDETTSIVVQQEPKKPHSQKRRKRMLLISQKLDDCEIYVMASRLTERDMINKLKEEQNSGSKEVNKQKNLDEYLDR